MIFLYFIIVNTASRIWFHCLRMGLLPGFHSFIEEKIDLHLYWEEHWGNISQTSIDDRFGGMTQTSSLMGTFVFWNALLASKILAVSLCIAAITIFILNELEYATVMYDLSKPIPLIWEVPFAQWHAKTFHESEHSLFLILLVMS